MSAYHVYNILRVRVRRFSLELFSEQWNSNTLMQGGALNDEDETMAKNNLYSISMPLEPPNSKLQTPSFNKFLFSTRIEHFHVNSTQPWIFVYTLSLLSTSCTGQLDDLFTGEPDDDSNALLPVTAESSDISTLGSTCNELRRWSGCYSQ